MAGNSVPGFFGRKARSKRPPGIDVTSITDLSGSMGPYATFISSSDTLIALENALRSEGVGIASSNRYSLATGGDSVRNTLPEIEVSSTVNGVSQRWVTGTELLNGTAQVQQLRAGFTGNFEDMGLAANLITNNDRGYLGANERIIVAGSDEQSYGTAFTASPPYPHRYVGVHTVTLSITEPAGPNPIPTGTLIGFVYTTNTTGAAIYLNGSTINYRAEVPVSSVTATAASAAGGPTLQINVDRAAATNGAIYNIAAFSDNFAPLATSLGVVLGRYLFETS